MKKTTHERHSFMDQMDELNNMEVLEHSLTDSSDDEPIIRSKYANVSEEDIEPVHAYEMDEYVDPEESSDETYKSCNCLPSCTSIHYDVEISQSMLNLVQYYKANNMYDKEDEE